MATGACWRSSASVKARPQTGETPRPEKKSPLVMKTMPSSASAAVRTATLPMPAGT